MTPADDSSGLDRRTAAAARAYRASGALERRSRPCRRAARSRGSRAWAGGGACAAGRDRGRPARGRDRASARSPPEPGATIEQRARLHQQLSLILRFREGLEAAEEHAQASVDLAERLADDALLGAALGGLALIRFNAGKEERWSWRSAPSSSSPPPARGRGRRPRFLLAHVLVWSHELEQARELLERLGNRLG